MLRFPFDALSYANDRGQITDTVAPMVNIKVVKKTFSSVKLIFKTVLVCHRLTRSVDTQLEEFIALSRKLRFCE